MKHRAVLSTVCVVLLTLALLALQGCGNSDSDAVFNYEIAYAQTFSDTEAPFDVGYVSSSIRSDLAVTVDSLSELKSLCKENGLPFYDESSANYDGELSLKIREYDENYFREKSLALIFGFGKSYATARIEEVRSESRALKVTFSKPDVMFEVSVPHSFVYLIEYVKTQTERIDRIEIDFVINGTMYALHDAYERGLMSAEDVRNIGYYYHGGKVYVEGAGFKEADFVAAPKTPGELDRVTSESIRRTYLDYLYYSGYGKNSLEDVTIDEYMGTYNGCVAVKLSLKNCMYLNVFVTQSVAGTTFAFPDSNALILLWQG